MRCISITLHDIAGLLDIIWIEQMKEEEWLFEQLDLGICIFVD